MFGDTFYEDDEQQQNNLSGTEEDYELWECISTLKDFISKRGAEVLVYHMDDDIYEPLAKEIKKDMQEVLEWDKNKLKILSLRLQNEAVCKDSY
jgi:hypothetical protein